MLQHQSRDLRGELSSFGASQLSDLELLGIVIGSDLKGIEEAVLSRMLCTLDSNCSGVPTDIHKRIATKLEATAELIRRRVGPQRQRVRGPADVLPLLEPYRRLFQEHFLALSLNGAHEVIALRVITIGLVDRTQVHPREVFADALCDRAVGIILAHNHPSGDTTPSSEDYAVTKRLVDAGDLIGIKVLDHIILSRNGYRSLKEDGFFQKTL